MSVEGSCNSSISQILKSFIPQQQPSNSKDRKQNQGQMVADQKNDYSSFLDIENGIQIVGSSRKLCKHPKNKRSFGMQETGYEDYPTNDYERSSGDQFLSIFSYEEGSVQSFAMKILMVLDKPLTIIKKQILTEISSFSKNCLKTSSYPLQKFFSVKLKGHESIFEDQSQLDSLFTFREKPKDLLQKNSSKNNLYMNYKYQANNQRLGTSAKSICYLPLKIDISSSLPAKRCFRELYLPKEKWKVNENSSIKLMRLLPDLLKQQIIDEIGFSPELFAVSPRTKDENQRNNKIKKSKDSLKISRPISTSLAGNRQLSLNRPCLRVVYSPSINFSPRTQIKAHEQLCRGNSSNKQFHLIVREDSMFPNKYAPYQSYYNKNKYLQKSPIPKPPSPFIIEQQKSPSQIKAKSVPIGDSYLEGNKYLKVEKKDEQKWRDNP